MKLKDFKEKLHVFELVHPDMGKTGCNITVRSPRCNEYVFRAIELSRSEQQRSAEQSFADNCALLALLVVAWDESFFDMECTTENVQSILTNFEYSWIREQIQREVDQAENFFPNK